MRSLCYMSGTRRNSRTETIRFLWKQMWDISARSGSLDQRNCHVSGTVSPRRGRRDGIGWETDGQNGKDRVLVGIREYWHIHNLLSASFPEIADLPRSIPVSTRSPGFKRPGSSRGIVSRHFDEIAPKIYCSRRTCSNLGLRRRTPGEEGRDGRENVLFFAVPI